jgi:hypothetical protein
LSVEAVQVRLIEVAKVAVAIRFAGAVGGVVSGGGGVVEEPLEHPPSPKRQLAPSITSPRHLDSIRFANRLFILGSIEASVTLDNLKEVVPGERKPPCLTQKLP